MTLSVVPVTFRRACEFIVTYHRHHGPPRGMKFAVGVADNGKLVGVATVGRPVARVLDDGRTVEVTRTCVLPVPNVNSMLYGAAWRAARAMGYTRMITYTQEGESGSSLRAAGFLRVAELRARPGWHTPSRPRADTGVGHIARTRWEIRSTGPAANRGDHDRYVAWYMCGSPSCWPAVSAGTAGVRPPDPKLTVHRRSDGTHELGHAVVATMPTMRCRQASAGVIPHRRFGKHYRFSREDVEAIVQQMTREPRLRHTPFRAA